ncbi:MAG: hypothetical protein HPY50_02410 [Firmicutes bacterium]|nr:hypothetical protein [Bacillota bacterium]
MRTLTSRQIKKLYFGSKGSTGANRISELKRAGLIKPNKVIRNGHKDDTCYYISPAGMRAIGQKGDRPRKNFEITKRRIEKSSLELQDYYIMRSEIYATLSPEWYWEDSREVKVQQRLNFSSLIAGTLRHGDNTYAVYLMLHSPEETTLRRVHDEIFYNRAAGRFEQAFILCVNEDTIDKIIASYRPGPIFVLPYQPGLKMLALNEPPYSLLARVYGEHPDNTTTRRYARYETVINGESCLVNQLLYNNLDSISAMRYYTKDIYLKEKLRLIVLVEKGRLDYYTRIFTPENYPHFVWETVDIEALYQEKVRL